MVASRKAVASLRALLMVVCGAWSFAEHGRLRSMVEERRAKSEERRAKSKERTFPHVSRHSSQLDVALRNRQASITLVRRCQMPSPKKNASNEIKVDEGTLLFVVAAILLLPLIVIGFFSQ